MKAFLSLWLPIFLSNSIIMLGGLFDTIFLSHFSPMHVAAQAVCLSVYSLVFVSGMGLLQGMMQELSEANGRQAFDDIQRIVKQSIFIILCLSAFAGWMLTHAEPLLQLLAIGPELKALIEPCLYLLAWTIPAHLLLRILYILTQSCGQSKYVLYANAVYLLLKVGLAYVLIFGLEAWSIPAYGVVGAFIAHLISQWLMLPIYYFFFLEKKLLIHWGGAFFHFSIMWNVLKIGLPSAVVVFIDVFTVSAIALLVLPLGDLVVNAHQIALGLCGLMFMLPLSLSSAFSILVSTQIGAARIDRALILTQRALMVVFAIALCVATMVLIFRMPILNVFSNDVQVLTIGLSLIVLLCLMHISDALLVISVSMLRCWKVIVLPMFIFSSMLLVLGLGGGWYLAYHPIALLGFQWSALGISGFWWMLAIAYTIAACLCFVCLLWRYRRVEQQI